MQNDEQPPSDPAEDLATRIVMERHPDAVVIGNYVVVAEVMTPTGLDLFVGVSDNTPYWHLRGMVEAGYQMVEDSVNLGKFGPPEGNEDE